MKQELAPCSGQLTEDKSLSDHLTFTGTAPEQLVWESGGQQHSLSPSFLPHPPTLSLSEAGLALRAWKVVSEGADR